MRNIELEAVICNNLCYNKDNCPTSRRFVVLVKEYTHTRTHAQFPGALQSKDKEKRNSILQVTLHAW